MKTAHVTLESAGLKKGMGIQTYGDAGRPVIVFPEGDASFDSWSQGGMTDALASIVDAGKAFLVCVDSVDTLGWYSHYAVSEYRLGNILAYFSFIENDLLAWIRTTFACDDAPVLAGVGMGALNATALVLDRPELFGGLLAISGTYDARAFTAGELPEGWEQVSPIDVVRGLSKRSKKVRLLKDMPLAFCTGTGVGEDGVATQRGLEEAFAEKGIPATFEYWGGDFHHNWESWHEEARELLPCVLEPEGLEKRRSERVLAGARRAAEKAHKHLLERKDKLAVARATLTVAEADVKATSVRLKNEEKNVEARSQREGELAAVAREAWAARDRAAEVLALAEEKARAAQAEADAATKARQDGEWILGEARADANRAHAVRDGARQAVEDKTAKLDAAKERERQAQEALDEAEKAADAPSA